MVQEYHDDNFPRISDSTIESVKAIIRFHRTAYRDDDGKVKLGYGTSKIRGKSIQLSSTCDEPEATQWLQDDLIEAGNMVKINMTGPLDQKEFDTLVSVAYKMGPDKFTKVIEDADKNYTQAKKDTDQTDNGHSETETL